MPVYQLHILVCVETKKRHQVPCNKLQVAVSLRVVLEQNLCLLEEWPALLGAEPSQPWLLWVVV